ncbi:MAG: type II toxin-antitoxin system VapB family antitoxin [Methylovulum sp.]|nr:type II toxin-antitoxin system VapB family antitoxin [Methylovulum sp.]
MRTTITLDEALLLKAQALSGLQERNALIREALNALIQRESAKRLAKLAGSETPLQDIPRQRETVL